MNIIYNEKQKVRFTNYKEVCEPLDLTFFIPNDFTGYSVFLILQSEAMYDVCPLTCSGSVTGYRTFILDGTLHLRVSGVCTVSLLLIQQDNIKLMEPFSISLDVERYKIAHQTYLTQQLSQSLADMYSQIQSMTQMNIDIYDAIVAGKGDKT